MWLEIAGRRIGMGEPLFAIAEIGLNHGGSADRALTLVDAAAQAGASAVKVQVIDADRLVAVQCPAPAHVAVASLRDFFRQFELSLDTYAAVANRAHEHGLAFIATPFSIDAVDALGGIGVDAYKIASGDLTFDQLVERAARTEKPLILSTGLATLAETAHAVAVARLAGNRQLALLHCVSAYPVPEGSENLSAIATLAETFGVPVGLSDHASDARSVAVAVTLGASLYERHLMLLGDIDTVDAAVSSEPHAFAAAVRQAAWTREALGDGRKDCSAAEATNRVASRRALHAVRDLTAGHVVTEQDILILRPASGLPPQSMSRLIGTTLTRDVAAGTPFLDADLDIMRRYRAVA
jgi:sialic acid synthase SpsE